MNSRRAPPTRRVDSDEARALASKDISDASELAELDSPAPQDLVARLGYRQIDLVRDQPANGDAAAAEAASFIYKNAAAADHEERKESCDISEDLAILIIKIQENLNSGRSRSKA